MSIPEVQLETWSKVGSQTQSKETYATVRSALDDKTATYAGSIEIFLQGSYGNDTNVYRLRCSAEGQDGWQTARNASCGQLDLDTWDRWLGMPCSQRDHLKGPEGRMKFRQARFAACVRVRKTRPSLLS